MKTIHLIFVSAVLFGLFTSAAWSQPNTFTTVFYDPTGNGSLLGYSVIEMPDSGFLVAGEHNYMPVLLKMNKSGQLLWEKVYDPGYNGSCFTRITQTADGNVMVGGNTGEYGPWGPVFCCKMTPSGDTLWSRTFDPGYDLQLTWIEQTTDLGYIISSYADYPTPAPQPAMILKLLSNGDTAWSRALSAGSINTVAHVVREMPDGGYMVTGSFRNEGNSYDQALMIRLSASGNVEWAKAVTDPNIYGSSIYDVRVLGDTLFWYMVSNYNDYFLFSTNMAGDFLWGKDLNIWGSSGWSGYNAQMPKLHHTPGNGFMVLAPGQFASGVKTDSAGTAEWGAEIYLESVDVIPVSDSGYLYLGNGPLIGVEMAPTHNPQTGLIKTDALGQTDDCLWTGFYGTLPVQFTFEPIAIQVSAGVSPTSFHPEIGTLPVWTWNGCVAFIGGKEDRSENSPQLILSPNPSTGTIALTMEPATASPVNIRVFNATGIQVYQTATQISLPASLNLSHLPGGIYLLQATNSQLYTTKKLILNP